MHDERSGEAARSSDGRAWQPTSTPGIYKRGPSYVVRFRDARGKQRSKTARTLAEAKRLKAELATDVARGEYRPDTKQTFAQYAALWKETYTGRGSEPIRHETLRDYRRDIERASDFMGRVLLNEVDRQMVQAFATSLAKEGLKPATVRRILAPLKALLGTAADDGLIRYPLSGARIQVRLVGATSETGRDDAQVKVLTREQRSALLGEVERGDQGGVHTLMVRLMLESGLRIGEALALEWRDVERDPSRVRVRQRVRAGKKGAPKSRNSARAIPISGDTARVLAAHRLASPFSAADDLVFPTATGEPQHASNAYRWFNRAARTAGAPTGFHALRHTAGSAWLEAGVPITHVSVLLGHHNPAFTMRVYAHAIADAMPTGEQLAAALG